MIEILSLIGLIFGSVGIIISLWIYYKTAAGKALQENDSLKKELYQLKNQFEELKEENRDLLNKNKKLAEELDNAEKEADNIIKTYE